MVSSDIPLYRTLISLPMNILSFKAALESYQDNNLQEPN
jgi:hypothetical protein